MDPTEKEMAAAVAFDVRIAMRLIAGMLETGNMSQFASELAMVMLLARAADRRGTPRADAWELYKHAFMSAPVVPKNIT